MEKLIVVSAPSGAGKTSIVHFLLKQNLDLSFSVSACNRDKREGEIEGEDYYFLSTKDFKNRIKENAFLEWEEVYQGRYYGTLNSETLTGTAGDDYFDGAGGDEVMGIEPPKHDIRGLARHSPKCSSESVWFVEDESAERGQRGDVDGGAGPVERFLSRRYSLVS